MGKLIPFTKDYNLPDTGKTEQNGPIKTNKI